MDFEVSVAIHPTAVCDEGAVPWQPSMEREKGFPPQIPPFLREVAIEVLSLNGSVPFFFLPLNAQTEQRFQLEESKRSR
jgi:hypothetical protein